MMRALLADRFRLVVHNEDREVQVLAFVLAKPGKTGPHLQPHSEDPPCQTTASPASPPALGRAPSPIQTTSDGLPVLCNGIFGMPPTAPRHLRFAGRNVTIGFIADSLSAATNLGRPMVDQTGSAEPLTSVWSGRVKLLALSNLVLMQRRLTHRDLRLKKLYRSS